MYGAASRDRGQAANQPPDPECFTVRYDDFGDYAPGRGPLLRRDVKPLNPPVDEGRQGFFDLPQEWLAPA